MDTKLKKWAATLGAVLAIAAAVTLVARKVVTMDDILADPPPTGTALDERLREIIAEVQGHHDTIESFQDVHDHISGIENSLVTISEAQIQLREAQEEYQDSAIASRQRQFCRENPGAC